jgi:cyanophycinase-like exopeptidase
VTVGSNDFLQAPFLQNTITDSHYSQRKRQGRHLIFMARMMLDAKINKVRGIGIDEATAICVDENGVGKVFGKNYAYFLKSEKQLPETCKPASPFSWYNNQQAVQVQKLQATMDGSNTFNLKKWKSKQVNSVPFFYFVKDGVLDSSNHQQ